MTNYGTVTFTIQTEIDLDELANAIGEDYSREELIQIAFEDYCEELETTTSINDYITIGD